LDGLVAQKRWRAVYSSLSMEAIGLGASVAAATNIFSYNRDAWMTDVQVKQNRRAQRQQMLVSQYDMFREDIRDTVGSNITRQNNYIVIATLLLGMMGECFIEGPMPSGASNFLEGAYTMCITSSLVYLVLSVLCAIAANHLAVGWQRSLLTRQVRLPIPQMIRELEMNSEDESVEAFEQQGFNTMLRVPGLSRLRKTAPKPPAQTRSGFDDDRQLRSVTSVVSDESGYADGTQDNHLQLFKRHAASFEKLEQLCMLFGAMGLHHLLQGYAFFAAAKYNEGRAFTSIVVPMAISMIDAILTWAYFDKGSGGWTGVACAIGAILFAVVGIRTHDRWDDGCICLSFACQVMTNVLGHLKLRGATQSDESDGVDNEEHASAESFEKKSMSVASQMNTVQQSSRVASLGTSFVVVAWISMMGWVLFDCSRDWITDGDERPSASGRNLRGLVSGDSWDFEPVAVAWPDEHFTPHTLACAATGSAGDGGHCVVANELLIFKLRNLHGIGVTEGETLEHVPCNVSGSIIDVALECGDDADESQCHTLVLSRGPTQTSVVNCSTGEARRLVESAPGSTTQFAIAPPSPGAWSSAQGILLAAQGGKDGATAIVQHGRIQPDLGSWAPLWTVATPQRREVAAVQMSRGGGAGDALLVGYANGLLEVFNLRQRSPQRVAALSTLGLQPLLPGFDHSGRLLSAALTGRGSVLVLLGVSQRDPEGAGEMVRLGRARWPQGSTVNL